ncbi:MAG: hypothetical protein K2M80_05445, partial [Muribaculaceae bacterium]|nr:hypothetical protein [Muribaculaceae bacterium]
NQYSEGRLISPFGAQKGLFDELYGASDVTEATVLMLADLLNHARPTELRRVLESYNQSAREAAEGQLDMFTGQRDTKEDILKRHIEKYAEQNKQQRQRTEAEAAAARRAAAGEGQSGGSQSDQQTQPADERSGESGERGAAAADTGNAGLDGKRTGDLAQREEIEYNLSSEIDENGRQFVLTRDGNISYGEITADNNLPSAPILLSEGLITNSKTNDGYGLVHIEARHGEEIRSQGYNSVLEFIEDVAKNFDVIKEGIVRDGRQTYMLQLKGKHNKTLMIELVEDGGYYTINTAGVFKNSYGKNRKVVYDRHTTEKQPVEAVADSQLSEQRDTTDNSRMDSATHSSEGKDSALSSEKQAIDAESTEPYTIT